MNASLILGASVLTLCVLSLTDRASAPPPPHTPIIRGAQLEIDRAQLPRYTAALREEAETSIRTEPGVLTLYAVAVKGHPERIRIFEMYADSAAYAAHIASPHFKKYKSGTQAMVKSLTLLETDPVFLGTKRTESLGSFVTVR
ncbi:MAG: antibiotic biosynthesis monooxygenase [bacterium]